MCGCGGADAPSFSPSIVVPKKNLFPIEVLKVRTRREIDAQKKMTPRDTDQMGGTPVDAGDARLYSPSLSRGGHGTCFTGPGGAYSDNMRWPAN